MPDPKAHARVSRHRKARRQRGETETNVWIPRDVQIALDQAVAAGQFPSRRTAIIFALNRVFLKTGEAQTT
jgi:hypothetical protein